MFGCNPSPTATPSTACASDERRRLQRLFERAFAHFGPRHWWPGDTRFEVCIGAILTQNTAWTNVEKAIANLRTKKWMSVRAIHDAPLGELAATIRPSGYYNQKAKKLKAFCGRVVAAHGGRLERFLAQDAAALRAELLAINGVGPETADSIVLYAANKPIFVVDAYTRRIVHRMGLTAEDISYDDLQSLFHRRFRPDAAFYNEFHALIVAVGKEYCRKRAPRCPQCPNSYRRVSQAAP